MPQLVYPNPDKYTTIHQQYLHLLLGDDSALLPAILASAAGHMAIAGLLPDVEFLERRQAALRKMARIVRYELKGTGPRKSLAEIDASIAASMILTGLEVIEGGGISLAESSMVIVRHLLIRSMPASQGAFAHLESCIKWSDSLSVNHRDQLTSRSTQ